MAGVIHTKYWRKTKDGRPIKSQWNNLDNRQDLKFMVVVMRKMKGNGFKKYVEERAVNLKEDLHYIFFPSGPWDKFIYPFHN